MHIELFRARIRFDKLFWRNTVHCPSCGQQQVSNETKFCSRCGLPLGLISEVVAYGGYLPQLAELNKKKKPILTRRNGLGFSLIWLLFFLLVMTPLWGISGIDELAAVSAIFGIFGGLIFAVSSLIFLKSDSSKLPPHIKNLYAAQNAQSLYGQESRATLPPQQSVPIADYASPAAGSWRDTNDLSPTSVTEGTTKLLEHDQ